MKTGTGSRHGRLNEFFGEISPVKHHLRQLKVTDLLRGRKLRLDGLVPDVPEGKGHMADECDKQPRDDMAEFIEQLAAQFQQREQQRQRDQEQRLAAVAAATAQAEEQEAASATEKEEVQRARSYEGLLTPEQQAQLLQRVESLRLRDRQRAAQRLLALYERVTEDEAMKALELCADSVDEAAAQLASWAFLQDVRHQLARAATAAAGDGRAARVAEDSSGAASGVEARTGSPVTVSEVHAVQRKRKAGRGTDGEKKFLRLEDALRVLKEADSFDGWSEARIRAWKARDTAPNAYYYRFNAPGEAQRNGPWDEAEKRLFFQRMAEIGIDGQWGVFAMAIPGRVGYQCANFYRYLVKTGQVKDDRYIVDPSGKLSFVGQIHRASKAESAAAIATPPAPAAAAAGTGAGALPHVTAGATGARPAARRHRHRAHSDDSSDDEYYGSYVPAAEPAEEDNPLPDFIDSVTFDVVRRPAIAPHGIVLSYDTWMRCMPQGSGLCPLTKRPVRKRELVLLTKDNIAQYRDKIVNCG